MNRQEPDEHVRATSGAQPPPTQAPPRRGVSPAFLQSLLGPEKRVVRVILAGSVALIVISLVVALVPGQPSAPGGAEGTQAAPQAAATQWPATPRAGELRQQAVVACKGALWEKCEADLNEAARLDPKGDEIAVIQRWRGKIAEGLHRD